MTCQALDMRAMYMPAAITIDLNTARHWITIWMWACEHRILCAMPSVHYLVVAVTKPALALYGQVLTGIFSRNPVKSLLWAIFIVLCDCVTLLVHLPIHVPQIWTRFGYFTNNYIWRVDDPTVKAPSSNAQEENGPHWLKVDVLALSLSVYVTSIRASALEFTQLRQ